MKLFLIVILSFFAEFSFAQIRNDFGINFQAIARNSDGSIIPNKNITVRLSIKEGGEDGAIIYQEIKSIKTNVVGLFTIILGTEEFNRIVVIGKFGDINWQTINKYLQVEVDPNNSIVFSLLGIQKINFVPYALHSLSTEANNIHGIVSIEKGGTGSSTAAGARTNLGLVIGTDILAQRTFGTAANSNISDFEPTITKGLASQFLRGDKTWQTLNTDLISEGTNLYFTNNRSRNAVSLTNIGTSGAATYDNITGVLNIPVYTLTGSGEVPLTFSTGLTRNLDIVTVNTTQNILKLSNLTGNGFIKTNGGDGTLTVDNNNYLLDRTFGTAANSNIGDFEPTIANGLTTQFLRGDKTWQTLNTDAVSEGTNLFFSNEHSRNAISLTNIGNSGAATYNNSLGIINIPTYSLTGLGGESPLTFSTGLTRTSNTVSVNTTQNILKLSNLSQNGFIKTSGGDGILTVDNNNYLTTNENIILSGDIIGSGTNTITTTIGNNKVTNAMLAGSIDLTTKVTNILPVSNGGTGTNTLSGILLGNATGALSTAAYGAFCDLTQQTAAVINTPYPMQLNTTELNENVTIQNNLLGNKTRITVAKAGKYNLQFSAQINRVSGTTQADVSIWLRKNEIDVPNTCTDISITGSALTTAPTVAAWNFIQQLDVGDYLELMWSTTNNTIVIQYAGERTSPIRPAIPSLIVTMQQVN